MCSCAMVRDCNGLRFRPVIFYTICFDILISLSVQVNLDPDQNLEEVRLNFYANGLCFKENTQFYQSFIAASL